MFQNPPTYGYKDAENNVVRMKGEDDIAYAMQENGYTTYLGMDGAINFLTTDIAKGKVMASFAEGNLPFYYNQKIPEYDWDMINIPSLPEMAQRAIENLYSNESGFCLMIEEASIDKAGHEGKPKFVAAEMGIMDQTLDVVLNFYNEHPNETLVIVTADHETGNHRSSSEKIEALNSIDTQLPWNGTSEEINNYLYDVFGYKIDTYVLDIARNYIKQDTFKNDYDNRAYASARITALVENSLGIKMKTNYHSIQQIPLLAIGRGADQFSASTVTTDIPHIICDILEWEDTLGLD